MSNNFNFNFWKQDYIERFHLDREGIEMLNYFIQVTPDSAKNFIKDKYTREVYREDIIDKYCLKYNSKKINQLLDEMEYENLTADEIKYYKISEQKEKIKPKCALIGENGNIFNLMGIASRTLKRNNMQDEAKEMCDRITSAKSYDEALCIIAEYVDICSKEEMEEDSEDEEY